MVSVSISGVYSQKLYVPGILSITATNFALTEHDTNKIRIVYFFKENFIFAVIKKTDSNFSV